MSVAKNRKRWLQTAGLNKRWSRDRRSWVKFVGQAFLPAAPSSQGKRSACPTIADNLNRYCQLRLARHAHPFIVSYGNGESDLCPAVFGSGRTLRKLKGVTDTAVGYAGGAKENPTYEDVCTDETGHAEVVQVELNPAKISYRELLDVFWANHNPHLETGRDRCGQTVSLRHFLWEQRPRRKNPRMRWQSGRFKREIVPKLNLRRNFSGREYHQRYRKNASFALRD